MNKLKSMIEQKVDSLEEQFKGRRELIDTKSNLTDRNWGQTPVSMMPEPRPTT